MTRLRRTMGGGGPVAPVNRVLPTITGAASNGVQLTAAVGTWAGSSPITYTYQWVRCDTAGVPTTDISGATGVTYNLVSADVGTTIRVRVTATNVAGSASASSAQTAVVVNSTSTIAYRSGTTGGTTSSATVTVNVPSGVVDGDQLIVALGYRGTGTGFAVPTGWTLVIDQVRGTSGRLQVMRRTAAAEPASYTFTASAAAGHLAAMHAFTGVSTSAPINASGGSSLATATTTPICPSVTTTVAGTLLLRAVLAASGTGGTIAWTWETPATKRLEPQNNTSGTSAASTATEPLTPAGVTGPRSATTTQSLTYATVTVALTPA